MRRLVWGTVAALSAFATGAMAITACVGEDPQSSNTIVLSPEAGSTPDGGGGTPDSGATDSAIPDPGTDSGTDSAVKVTCDPPDPQLFAPGEGPFCQGAPLNHCAFGQHCCRDTALNTQVCAASCPNGVVDMACYNTAECNPGGDFDAGGLRCCAKGTVALGVCSYAVTENLRSTGCFATCMAGEFQACASQSECETGKVCTPTKALRADGTRMSSLQLAACR